MELDKEDKKIIEAHELKTLHRMVPCAVEMVLKLLRKVNGDYYELQNVWEDAADEANDNEQIRKRITGEIPDVPDITFLHRLMQHGESSVSVDTLFKTVEEELKAQRYVIMRWPYIIKGRKEAIRSYTWLVYHYDCEKDDYLAFAKDPKKTTINKATLWSNEYMEQIRSNSNISFLKTMKDVVRELGGVNILTYRTKEQS